MSSRKSIRDKIRKLFAEERPARIPGKVIRVILFKIYSFFLQRAWTLVTVYYRFQMRKYPELKALYSYYRSASDSTGVSVADAVVLYETVRKRRPAFVLEFGTGASTSFMALGLKHNYQEDSARKGMIVSVENDRFYLEHQLSLYPGELKEFTTFVHSDLGQKQYDGEAGSFYRTVPQYPYDMIWVDGPALTEELPFSGDVIDVLHYCASDIRILFDGRDKTALKAISMIGNKYTHKHYPLLHMWEIWKRDL